MSGLLFGAILFSIEERLADSKRRDGLRVCDNNENVNKNVLVERFERCATLRLIIIDEIGYISTYLELSWLL